MWYLLRWLLLYTTLASAMAFFALRDSLIVVLAHDPFLYTALCVGLVGGFMPPILLHVLQKREFPYFYNLGWSKSRIYRLNTGLWVLIIGVLFIIRAFVPMENG